MQLAHRGLSQQDAGEDQRDARELPAPSVSPATSVPRRTSVTRRPGVEVAQAREAARERERGGHDGHVGEDDRGSGIDGRRAALEDDRGHGEQRPACHACHPVSVRTSISSPRRLAGGQLEA
jgi:hypothetical protein